VVSLPTGGLRRCLFSSIHLGKLIASGSIFMFFDRLLVVFEQCVVEYRQEMYNEDKDR
jgi:hypothetical protein